MNSDFSWKGGPVLKKSLLPTPKIGWDLLLRKVCLILSLSPSPPPPHTPQKKMLFDELLLKELLKLLYHLHVTPTYTVYQDTIFGGQNMGVPDGCFTLIKKKIVQLWMKNQKEFTNVRNLSSKHRVYSLLQQYVHRF